MEGSPALEPDSATDDDVLHALGAPAAADARRAGGIRRRRRTGTRSRCGRHPASPAASEVVCHHDIFPPNVILRDGLPVALSTGTSPGLRRASTTSPRRRTSGCRCAPTTRRSAGVSRASPRGERLRLLCDAYGLERERPARAARRRRAPEPDRLRDPPAARRGAPAARLAARCGTPGSGDVILQRSAWFEAHRADLQRSLA